MAHRAASGGSERYRPLPPHPDIEFERKRAKRLLRAAREGDADAAQSMARVARDTPPDEWKLALAQLAVARDYGFSSWTRLKQYYEMWQRHAQTPKFGLQPQQLYEHRVRQVLSWHERKIPLGAQMTATFLPRLYGMPVDEVLASPLTEDEARFIVARQERRGSWDELVAAAPRERDPGMKHFHASPFGQALAAIREHDLPWLREVARAHPDLLCSVIWNGGPDSLLRNALLTEERDRTPESREICDWLAAQAGDLHEHLSINLARGHIDADGVEYLIARGADPNWVSPAGVSVIEYALLCYNISQSNPSAVDALLRHVDPIPAAFWIAAGIGDVAGTLRYLDRQGRPTRAARQRRPDFNILGPGAMPLVPDAPDEVVVFEAFWIATINGRSNILKAIVSRGYPVDSAPWHSTALHMAVGCASFDAVKCLLELGADPDAPQFYNTSPRWLATNMTTDPPITAECARGRIRDLLASWPAGAGA